MLETGPAKKNVQPGGEKYIRVARKLLGQLRARMGTNKSGWDRLELPDGTLIEVAFVYGQPQFRIGIRPKAYEPKIVWFVFRPAALEAEDGWGEPFTTGNLPLGTIGGEYPDSILRVRADPTDPSPIQFRRDTNYAGLSQALLTVPYGYGRYEWRSPAGRVLSVFCRDGNRYFGTEVYPSWEPHYWEDYQFEEGVPCTNCGDAFVDDGTKPEWADRIYYNGGVHAFVPPPYRVRGVGLASYDGTAYLYAVCTLRAEGDNLIDETFVVFRRVWQEAQYDYNGMADAIHTNGWVEIGTFNQPDYTVSHFYNDYGAGAASPVLTGPCGGAHFNPSGTEFIQVFRWISANRGRDALQSIWFPYYYKVNFGTDGTEINITQGNAWEVANAATCALDYSPSGTIRRLIWWAVPGTVGTPVPDTHLVFSIIEDGATAPLVSENIAVYYNNQDSPYNSYSSVSALLGIDLRDAAFIGFRYYMTLPDGSGSSLPTAEEISQFVCEKGVMKELGRITGYGEAPPAFVPDFTSESRTSISWNYVHADRDRLKGLRICDFFPKEIYLTLEQLNDFALERANVHNLASNKGMLLGSSYLNWGTLFQRYLNVVIGWDPVLEEDVLGSSPFMQPALCVPADYTDEYYINYLTGITTAELLGSLGLAPYTNSLLLDISVISFNNQYTPEIPGSSYLNTGINAANHIYGVEGQVDI